MLDAQGWQAVVARTPLGVLRQGVPDPFERLFLEEYPKVVAIAYRVLADRSAAEDVAQDVFMQFHRRVSPGDKRAAGWLHAAAGHSALNGIRGEPRRHHTETAPPRDPPQPTYATPE